MSAYSRSSGSWNADSRKNQLSSTSQLELDQVDRALVALISSASVLKSAQRGQ